MMNTAEAMTRTESMNQLACRVTGVSVVDGRTKSRRVALSKARQIVVFSLISVSRK